MPSTGQCSACLKFIEDTHGMLTDLEQRRCPQPAGRIDQRAVVHQHAGIVDQAADGEFLERVAVELEMRAMAIASIDVCMLCRAG